MKSKASWPAKGEGRAQRRARNVVRRSEAGNYPVDPLHAERVRRARAILVAAVLREPIK